jgi:hypothetical protein
MRHTVIPDLLILKIDTRSKYVSGCTAYYIGITVGNNRKLQHVTDRQIGVSRTLKQAGPELHRKGGE